MRWPLPWAGIQPTKNGGYHWEGFDEIVEVAARHGLTVLPFVYATPAWISPKYTTMPVNNARARTAWSQFLEAAVRRYGPGGEFWRQQAPGVVQYEPAIPRPVPIRTWQVWNEANFFYFAYPVSTARLRAAAEDLRAGDQTSRPRGQGDPQRPLRRTDGEGQARDAGQQLSLKPSTARRGSRAASTASPCTPTRSTPKTLEEMVEDIHEVTVETHDRVPLYITEMGWGSQNNFEEVAFEQGPRGQVKQLKASYGYLLENRRRLNLKQVYWFSWKDLKDHAPSATRPASSAKG